MMVLLGVTDGSSAPNCSLRSGNIVVSIRITFLSNGWFGTTDTISRCRFVIVDSDTSLPASLIYHGRLVKHEIFKVRMGGVRKHHQWHCHRWHRADHIVINVEHCNRAWSWWVPETEPAAVPAPRAEWFLSTRTERL
uniref:Uncharacterized protein n=1 Tax=Anopheles christyi TaxID=43041 RepID=A0A182KIB3_9DIPT